MCVVCIRCSTHFIQLRFVDFFSLLSIHYLLYNDTWYIAYVVSLPHNHFFLFFIIILFAGIFLSFLSLFYLCRCYLFFHRFWWVCRKMNLYSTGGRPRFVCPLSLYILDCALSNRFPYNSFVYSVMMIGVHSLYVHRADAPSLWLFQSIRETQKICKKITKTMFSFRIRQRSAITKNNVV